MDGDFSQQHVLLKTGIGRKFVFNLVYNRLKILLPSWSMEKFFEMVGCNEWWAISSTDEYVKRKINDVNVFVRKIEMAVAFMRNYTQKINES